MFANTKLDDAVRRAIDLLESLGGEFNSLAEVLNGEIEKLARGKLKEVCPTIIAVSDGSWDCQEFHYPGFIQNFELRAKNKKKATAYLSYQVNFCPPPRIPMLLMVGIDDDMG